MGQREPGVSVTQYEGSRTRAGDRSKGGDYSGDFVHYTKCCLQVKRSLEFRDILERYRAKPWFLHLIFGMSGSVSVLKEVKGLHCLGDDNSLCDRLGSDLDVNLHAVRDGNTPYRCKFHQNTDSV